MCARGALPAHAPSRQDPPSTRLTGTPPSAHGEWGWQSMDPKGLANYSVTHVPSMHGKLGSSTDMGEFISSIQVRVQERGGQKGE